MKDKMKQRPAVFAALFIALAVFIILAVWTSSYPGNRPIIIVSPMDTEQNVIKSSLENPNTKTIGDYEFTAGTIDGYPVISVRSLVGMVNSASATTLAINQYDPLCVIIQGTAGAHNTDLHTGDIVIGKDMVEINNYMSQYRKAGDGSNPSDWEAFGTEARINDKVEKIFALHSDKRLLEIANSVSYDKGNKIIGTSGSGDAWNKELDRINEIRSNLGTDCEDMEDFAVAQICRQYNVPVLAVRVISNNVFYPDEPFDESTGEDCQEFCINIIKAIKDSGFSKE